MMEFVISGVVQKGFTSRNVKEIGSSENPEKCGDIPEEEQRDRRKTERQSRSVCTVLSMSCVFTLV